jgi:hypothetical protein
MSTSVPTLGCPIREELVAQFTRVYRDYNERLATLLEWMPLAEATEGTRKLFDAAVHARQQISVHDWEHGCTARVEEE